MWEKKDSFLEFACEKISWNVITGCFYFVSVFSGLRGILESKFIFVILFDIFHNIPWFFLSVSVFGLDCNAGKIFCVASYWPWKLVLTLKTIVYGSRNFSVNLYMQLYFIFIGVPPGWQIWSWFIIILIYYRSISWVEQSKFAKKEGKQMFRGWN